ncbi:hypothetical protein ACFL47_06350 [Candidatus Latescibacterota bacterium]
MEKHITLVAALHIGFGILGIMLASVIFIAIVGAGLISGDEEAIAITSIVSTLIASFILLTSIPGIIGGIGLLKRREWARLLVLILSVLNLIGFPIGTAIGIYSLWALIQDETIQIISGGQK